MGTFDVFHEGHVRFLRSCRDLAGPGGEVVVGLNTDEFTESYKTRPVVGYRGREAVLLACEHVDRVVPNDQEGGTARGLIETVAPDVVAATMDYHPSNGKDWFVQIGTPAEWLADHGIRVVWIPYTSGITSTAIRSRL